jgi:hypothetical protein
MKKTVYILTLIFSSTLAFSQDDSGANQEDTNDDNYGWSKRISFFVGAGTSVIANDIYELPIIDKTNNTVIIEKSGKLKPNVSTGIVYTPFVYNVPRLVKYIDDEGNEKTKKIIEHVPKHFSVALFINPVNLASSNSNLNTSVDLGFGLGWRSDNFSVFATMEFFGINQPRDYFVQAYKTNDQQYVIGGEIQTAIDINDNTIFKNQIMTSFGIKLAYTFDIVSRYSKASNQ